jgi:hypothetical protein
VLGYGLAWSRLGRIAAAQQHDLNGLGIGELGAAGLMRMNACLAPLGVVMETRLPSWAEAAVPAVSRRMVAAIILEQFVISIPPTDRAVSTDQE